MQISKLHFPYTLVCVLSRMVEKKLRPVFSQLRENLISKKWKRW